MLQSLAVVLAVVIGAGALLQGLTWARRERIVRSIDPASVVRQARGVSLRILTQGQVTLPGMNPGRANRTRGDLVLTADRFLVGSARGVLVDVGPGGRKLRSVRSTGPGRLVIEGGDRPDGVGGSWRIELVLDDAAAWVAALAPHCMGESEFATLPGEPLRARSG
ncbi:MAG: hypothetical protein H6737_20375 [Alphaproteobacteria bacterium]|nr:hypothetical protein [Alphaproteobacteria bacterium]